MDREGKSVTVSDQVELAPESAARAAQCVVGGFVGAPFFPAPAAERDARTIVPSTHHRSQSMCPSASSRTCNAANTRSYTPDRRRGGHMRFDQYPLFIREFITAHPSDPPSLAVRDGLRKSYDLRPFSDRT